jgi:HSP20 family protein
MLAATTMEKAKAGSTSESAQSTWFYRSDIDVHETDAEYVVYADMPGATSEDLDIRYDRGMLMLRARIKARQDPEKTSYLIHEYGVADYQQEFRIGEEIDTDGISAEFRDGVLILRLPKSARPRLKKIEVKQR